MRLTVRHIQDTVAEYYGAPASIMRTDQRFRPLSNECLYRHIAAYFAREKTNHSYGRISSFFNRKDHTTARFSDLKVQRLIAGNEALAADIIALRQVIGSNKYTVEKSDQLVGDSATVDA